MTGAPRVTPGHGSVMPRIAVRAPALVLMLVLMFWSSLAQAQFEDVGRQTTTRSRILQIGRSALDNGYKWGGSTWSVDPAGHVSCSFTMCSGCECKKRNANGSCFSYYPIGGLGADCSGFVGKSWEVPGPRSPEMPERVSGTAGFIQSGTHWDTIAATDIRPGDSMAWNNGSAGHVVLIKEKLTGDNYEYYEASSCKNGIRHHRGRLASSKWTAARRKDIEEVECTPDPCSGHGTCSPDTGCTCDTGYAGEACGRCDDGYVGYPTCRAADSMCKPAGSIACGMSPIELSPQDADNQMFDYACNLAGQGGEMAFRFAPHGAGSAKIRLTGSTAGKALGLLRGSCDPQGCVESQPTELQIDYGSGEAFFVVVESELSTSGTATLHVDCNQDADPFIGDPCNSDDDCEYMHKGESGFCYRSEGGGICSLRCKGTCPDFPSHRATTMCVEDPSDEDRGICVPRAQSANDYCAALPGTGAQTMGRFKATGGGDVCYPGAAKPACQGSLAGRVVDFMTDEPLEGATVAVTGGSDLTTNTEGNYESSLLACGTYPIQISAEGYVTETGEVEIADGEVTQVTRLRALPMGTCADGGVLNGYVFDALSPERKPIEGAAVEVRRGLSNASGDAVLQATTDPDGRFAIDGLASGNYELAASADGYATGYANTAVCGGLSQEETGVALAPAGETPYRVVLEWAQPNDLDLHVQLPSGEEIYFYDPCRGGLGSSPYAALDVDRQRPDGPESIAFSQFLPGRYTVFVHNYSLDDGDTDIQLTDSDAEVVVYAPGGNTVLGRFSVPAYGNGSGWDVFSFDGSDPENLQSIQRLTDRPHPETDYAHDCHP
ncbi:MAG: carboxypeptidase regulatory-like domain-containing protein [Myxococcales bacterium]|nr:carboxypeptidase regulatory-like domain-containing protein [Myxococcales bacterium]